jgi:uncharacterized protein YecA (UPF0149 family)
MGKIKLINDYMNRCAEILQRRSYLQAEILEKEIISVFGSEIQDITSNLSVYEIGTDTNFFEDLTLLKAILENYKSNLELEEERRKDEIEILRLKQPISTAHFNNQNTNSSSANANATNIVEVKIEQALENIANLNEEILSKDDKDKLEGLLSSIEVAKNSKDKDKLLNKIGNVLKFIAEKGVQVGIATLPYLGEVSKFVSSLKI